MRGIAALCVVALHLRVPGFRIAPGGYLAVDLFFLLSGVVIASAYDWRIDKGMTATQFMRARLTRLYPMYLLGLAACLIAGATTSPATPMMVGSAVLFVPGPLMPPFREMYPAMPIAWSLAYELLANVAFVTFHRHLSRRVLIAAIVISGLILGHGVFVEGSLDVGPNFSAWPIGLARVSFSFPLGILVWRERARFTFALSPWLALPAVALMCAIHLDRRAAFDLITVIVVWPLLVRAACNSRASMPMLATLGAISYPLYCLHGIFLTGPLKPHTVPASLIAVALSITAAYVATRFYDQPVRAWLSRQTAPRKALALA